MRVHFAEYEGGLTVRRLRPKPLAECSFEEMAAVVRQSREPTPGVAFARKDSWCRELKLRARYRVMQAFDGIDADRAFFFTLPGLAWTFESLLFQRRKRRGLDTFFYCVENDPAVFRAALVKMPFMHRTHGYTSLQSPAPFAKVGFRSARIARFYNCDFEDAAKPQNPTFDGAWLDFTGPLTPRLLAAIRVFWPRVRSTLVVTSLGARWPEGFSEIVADRGVPALLSEACPGSVAPERYDYFDGVPMLQVTLTRAERAPSEVLPLRAGGKEES